MLNGFKKRNLNRVNLVNQRASRKNKLRQQILWGKKKSKNDKLLEKEDYIYVPGKIYIYSSIYLDVCYVILITGFLNSL